MFAAALRRRSVTPATLPALYCNVPLSATELPQSVVHPLSGLRVAGPGCKEEQFKATESPVEAERKGGCR